MTDDAKSSACETLCKAACNLKQQDSAPIGTALSKQQLEAILRLAPMGVFLCDEQGRFLSVNQKMAELHGFDRAEEFLANVTHLNEQALLDNVAAREMRKTLELEDEVVDFEVQIETPAGGKHWLSRSVRAFRDESGEVLFLVGFEMDISERKELEEMRRRGESTARHDMKTPLLSIFSGLKLLKEHRDTAEKEGVLDTILEQARIALESIDQRMAQHKLEQGSYKLLPQPFDLVPIFQRVAKTFAGLAPNTADNLEFVINGEHLAESSSLSVYGEKHLIETMLANLIKNALEASPEGEPVMVSVSEEGDGWLLDVHNQGEVPEKVRSCFFEPYATEGKRDGAGLGTYSARLITEAHGGSIDFTTSQEEGTHVLIRLPREPGRVKRG